MKKRTQNPPSMIFWILIDQKKASKQHPHDKFTVVRRNTSDTRKKEEKTDWRLLVVTSHSDILIGH